VFEEKGDKILCYAETPDPDMAALAYLLLRNAVERENGTYRSMPLPFLTQPGPFGEAGMLMEGGGAMR